jgi:putative tricarboxylic transport membrane protein
VIAPIFELSLRQSLIMSNGNWLIFLERPIAQVLLAIALLLLGLAAASSLLKRRDWRAKLAEAAAGEEPASPAPSSSSSNT